MKTSPKSQFSCKPHMQSVCACAVKTHFSGSQDFTNKYHRRVQKWTQDPLKPCGFKSRGLQKGEQYVNNKNREKKYQQIIMGGPQMQKQVELRNRRNPPPRLPPYPGRATPAHPPSRVSAKAESLC
jgi:hypothetical protein